jgi:hypothetical protein
VGISDPQTLRRRSYVVIQMTSLRKYRIPVHLKRVVIDAELGLERMGSWCVVRFDQKLDVAKDAHVRGVEGWPKVLTL